MTTQEFDDINASGFDLSVDYFKQAKKASKKL